MADTCAHEEFAAVVAVARIEQVEGGAIAGFMAEVHITCVGCGEPMVFHGAALPVGAMLPGRPTINADGTELRAPCRPQSSDPHFGLGLSGFTTRQTAGGDNANN